MPPKHLFRDQFGISIFSLSLFLSLSRSLSPADAGRIFRVLLMRASLTLSRVSAFQMLANCFVSRCWLLFYHVPDDAGGGCRDAKLKHAAQELESQQKRCMYYSAKVGKTVYHVFDASKMVLSCFGAHFQFVVAGRHLFAQR